MDCASAAVERKDEEETFTKNHPETPAQDNGNSEPNAHPNGHPPRRKRRERKSVGASGAPQEDSVTMETPSSPSSERRRERRLQREASKESTAASSPIGAVEGSPGEGGRRRNRDSGGKWFADKQKIRELQKEKITAVADAEDLRQEKEEMVRSVEMERGLRKQGNKEAADSIAAAQAEVTTLKGQCKGLSSKIIQLEAESEAALEAARDEHQETKQQLVQLQAWVKAQAAQQEEERTSNESAANASRTQQELQGHMKCTGLSELCGQRVALETEKTEAKKAQQAAEQTMVQVSKTVTAAASEVGDAVRAQLDSLVEEIAKAQYDEDCSMARLDLIAKMAMIVRSTMDESLSKLEEVGTTAIESAKRAPVEPEEENVEEEAVDTETVRKWRQMRDTGMITQNEFVELTSLSKQPETPERDTQKTEVEKKVSKWSWRGGANKRQEELASVVRAAQAHMLEELKDNLRHREETVWELEDRLQQVQIERDEAIEAASQASVRSSSHQRSNSFDSLDDGLSEGCFTPREYSLEALRLRALNEELCVCQERYLVLPKGTERRELRVKMKELDRQCRHLQAQELTPTSNGGHSAGANSSVVLENALEQAENIAVALECYGSISPRGKCSSQPPWNDNASVSSNGSDASLPRPRRGSGEDLDENRSDTSSAKSSPTHRIHRDTKPSASSAASTSAAPHEPKLPPNPPNPSILVVNPPRSPDDAKPKSTPNSPTHSNSFRANKTASSSFSEGTPKTPPHTASRKVPAGFLSARGPTSTKNAVPIIGLAGSRVKAGSLSELIKQRKANKEHLKKCDMPRDSCENLESEYKSCGVTRAGHMRAMSHG